MKSHATLHLLRKRFKTTREVDKMEHESVVLIYSKYSKACNELMDTLGQMPPLLYRVLIMRYLCVDSESVREKMRKNQTVPINTVPTLLVNYADDVMEKYEGDDVYVWLDQFMGIVSEVLKPDTSELDDLRLRYTELEAELHNRDRYYEGIINQLQQHITAIKAGKVKQVTVEETQNVAMPQQHMSAHQDERIHQRASDSRRNAPSFDNTMTIHEVDAQSQDTDQPSKDTTSIDSLSGEELFTDERPPVPQIDGELSSSFKEHPTPDRGVVSSAADKKSASLMAEALKMQKSREAEEPPRPPGAPKVP